MTGTKTSILAAAVVSTIAGMASAQVVPTFSFGAGIRETNNAAGTAIGSNGGSAGAIEVVNSAGVSVLADGQYHTITFTFGTDPVTNPGLNTGNGILEAAFGLATFEHLRLNNISGVTKPTSVFIDDITNTPSGGSPVVLTDFSTAPNAIPNGTSVVGFREATNTTGTGNFARNYNSSAASNIQPETITPATPNGTATVGQQAGRINFRFSYPEAVAQPTAGQGSVRLVTSSTSALGPVSPVINVASGSTLTMRIAIVVNEPVYGWNPQSGNDKWSDNANWGRGPTAGTINAPNLTNATSTALFDEPLPTDGSPVVPRTVTLDVPVIAQTFQFTSPISHTINGDATNDIFVSRNAIDFFPVIDVEAGSHTINAPVTFTIEAGLPTTTFTPLIYVSTGASLNITQPTVVKKYILSGTAETNSLTKRGGGVVSLLDADVTTLTVVGGTINLTPSASNTTATVSLSGTGSTLNLTPSAGAVKTVSTLSIGGSSTSIGGSLANGDLQVTTANIGAGATLHMNLAGKRSIKVTTLTLNATGKLDLGDDGILVDYLPASNTTPAVLRTAILSAYAAGALNGKGIGSDLVTVGGSFGVGYKPLLTGDIFMGRTATDDTNFGIRYTYLGDGTLDGIVNFDDLVPLAQNYNGTGKVWSEGDYTYDGNVNFDDLVPLAQNYNKSLTALQIGVVGSTFAADFALARSLVPEPTTLAAVGALATMTLRRRRTM